jgi:anhydro-N-acetylmuramic acid kinase
VLSIGLMSGTSMDGIDAALLKTDGKAAITELGHTSYRYQPEFQSLLKTAERAVKDAQGNLIHAAQTFPQLNTVIQQSTELHSQLVKQLLQQTNYTAKQIDVIGYHGQTLYHSPANKITVQVGDAKTLAEQLGITVVNDFRRCDVNAGGQGAPFAPLYHQALAMRDQKYPLAVVNCGGIANISLIYGAGENDVIGFDTGPGNALIDRLVKQKTNGKEIMDEDSRYGLQGIVHENLLPSLYSSVIVNNYFQRKPPKALDINDLILPAVIEKLSLVDACATLEAFTADSIVNSVHSLNLALPKQWILAGGGWQNPVILRELKQRLQQKIGADVQVQLADAIGWNSQSLEAQIFAYLAVRSLQNLPLSVPSTTAVSKPISGGHAYLPSNNPTLAVAALIAKNPAVLSGYL